MPASALLKFTQGATVGGDGRALVGVLTTSVALSNVNNTGVQSWQIDLVYVDPDSSLSITTAYAFNDAGSTPAANFSPDVRRSYRWVLKVWDVPNRAGDPSGVDIRVFSVRELNGVLIPPSQVWPLPLPNPLSGELNAKPNEMNFDGQLDGWHGTGVDGQLNQVLAKHMPPLPGNPGDVLTVVSGRWASAPPSGGGGSGDVSGPGAAVVNNNVVLWDGTSGTDIKDSGLNLSAFIRHNGSVAFTANQSLGGFKITSLANGTAAGDAVNLAQLQAAINGLDPKGNVRAFSTSNVAALTGLGALGGVGSFTDGQRVGLGGQSTATQNGIWVVHVGAWTRPTDFATGMDVSGAYFVVEEGTFAERQFLVTSDTGAAVVDTNNLVLQDFGTSTVSAGNGLQKVGNVISVLHDGGTLSSSVSGLKVATDGITSNEMATGSVDLASNTVTGLLPFANIANGTATSVFGRSANSVGVMASIAASADGQVLRRSGGALAFGTVDLADGDAVTGLLPHANIASLAGLSVFGRGANTTGVMAAITGTDGQALRVAGTTLAFGQLVTAAYTDASVTLAKLANATASSVLGRSAATGGAYADIASSADGQVLRRGAAGVIAFGAVDLADADGVTGLLPFANITDGAANSVFGRAAGTTGVMASIAASADGQVLRMVAGSLAFGTVDLADADAVTGLLPFANMASLTALSVLGRATNTLGVMAAITAANDGEVLQRSGTTLVFATIGTTGLTDNSVTMAKLADLAGNSVIGRSANTSGDPAAITAGVAGQVLRLSGTTLAFGALDLADADAVTGLLPGTNVNPNFGTGAVIVGGRLDLGATPATSGDIRLTALSSIQFRNVGGSANLLALSMGSADEIRVGNTGAIGYQQSATNHDFRMAGATVVSMEVDRLNLGVGVLRIQFAAASASALIQQVLDSTPGATGKAFSIAAQAVTGTGATVGGLMLIQGGNSTSNVGGNFDARSGEGATAVLAGTFDMRIGSTRFFQYPGTVVPATTGVLRGYHNSALITGRDTGNANNRNGVRWGTTTDTWIFGDSAVATQVLGSTVQVGDSTTMIEVAELATNRDIISLLLGAALTTTQMPANTGDKVIFVADATTVPTSGLPVGGSILFNSSAMGFQGKGVGGVESTIVPKGDTTAVTRKLADLVVVDTVVTAATTEVSVVEFDLSSANFNGAAFDNGVIKVRFECVGYQNGGNNYSHGLHLEALIDRRAGTTTIVGSVNEGYTTIAGNGIINVNNPPTVATISVSGNVVRGRIAPFDATSTTWFGKMTVMGVAL